MLAVHDSRNSASKKELSRAHVSAPRKTNSRGRGIVLLLREVRRGPKGEPFYRAAVAMQPARTKTAAASRAAAQSVVITTGLLSLGRDAGYGQCPVTLFGGFRIPSVFR